MAGNIHFDIYVLKDGRWGHDMQFHMPMREDALQRAKELDSHAGNDGVRVIKVTIYGSNRAPTETIEWISPELKRVAAPSALKSGRSSGPPETNVGKVPNKTKTAAADPERELDFSLRKPFEIAPPGKRNWATLFVKGAVILTGAALVSWFLMAPLTIGVNMLVKRGVALSPDMAAIIVFVMAVACFCLTGLIAAKIILKPQDWAGQAPAAKKVKKKKDTRASRRQIVDFGESEVPRDVPFKPNIQPDSEDTVDQPEEPASEPDEGSHEPAAALSEGNRRTMLMFLERSLTELSDDIQRLDQYTVFGINLFLGGAVDRLSNDLGLTPMQKFVLIRESVSALGTPPERIEIFCAKFSDYDSDRKYRIMTDMGRRIMDLHLADDGSGFRELPDMMRRWRRSDTAAAQAQGIVVIMFTDLVGSTQMTHDRGDVGAQQIVRAHNAIVRTALAEFHGEEVKHTGDGIMASFGNPSGSVNAAIRIQQEIAAHNKNNPDFPVNLRIGLNAGDAVREEDDFFGQTVQLAARICDKADTGQIYITRSVRDLCQGHAFSLTETGPYDLKGIDQPVVAYNVAVDD